MGKKRIRVKIKNIFFWFSGRQETKFKKITIKMLFKKLISKNINIIFKS